LIPLLENQEIVSNGKDGISYWEGAVRTDNGCVGYLELTGYKDKPKI
jgi:predicted secreted hydrolase